MVAIEAMAAGRLVICPNADGLKSHIEAGALDVGENSPQGWVARLSTLQDADFSLVTARARQHAIGARARFVAAWNALTGGHLDAPKRNTRAA